jgi:hypothetical protein
MHYNGMGIESALCFLTMRHYDHKHHICQHSRSILPTSVAGLYRAPFIHVCH